MSGSLANLEVCGGRLRTLKQYLTAPFGATKLKLLLGLSKHSLRSFDSLDPMVWSANILLDVIVQNFGQHRSESFSDSTDLRQVLLKG